MDKDSLERNDSLEQILLRPNKKAKKYIFNNTRIRVKWMIKLVTLKLNIVTIRTLKDFATESARGKLNLFRMKLIDLKRLANSPNTSH